MCAHHDAGHQIESEMGGCVANRNEPITAVANTDDLHLRSGDDSLRFDKTAEFIREVDGYHQTALSGRNRVEAHGCRRRCITSTVGNRAPSGSGGRISEIPRKEISHVIGSDVLEVAGRAVRTETRPRDDDAAVSTMPQRVLHR